MQRDRARTREQVTTLICLAWASLTLACSADPSLAELTRSEGFALSITTGELRLRFLGEAEGLVARRKLAIEFEISEATEAAPDSIELVANMPSMSHGPTHATLIRDEGVYRTELLFVMGGEWVVEFRSGASTLGRVRCYVHER